jgi:hypothetical protein
MSRITTNAYHTSGPGYLICKEAEFLASLNTVLNKQKKVISMISHTIGTAKDAAPCNTRN